MVHAQFHDFVNGFGVPTPSNRAYTASFIIVIGTRFEMNPGKSWASTGTFPNFLASSTVTAVVSFSVARPLMISTSFMTGTGFMKCMPMNFSGLFVEAASLVMEMEEVLLASIPRGDYLVKGAENLLLQLEIFKDRFHYEIRFLEVIQVCATSDSS